MDHVLDYLKVTGVNTLAFVISFTDLEDGLRLAGLFAAFLYTSLKIIQIFRHWNSKDQDE
jgi:hypothetical protein